MLVVDDRGSCGWVGWRSVSGMDNAEDSYWSSIATGHSSLVCDILCSLCASLLSDLGNYKFNAICTVNWELCIYQ